MNKRRRLKELEKAQEPPEEQVKVVVDWTPAGEPRPPVEPGVTVITWEDIEGEVSGEDETNTP